MHPRVVEIVTQQTPGVTEHLSPLFPRVDSERPAVEVDLVLAQILDLLCLGGGHVEMLALADQQFLAVA